MRSWQNGSNSVNQQATKFIPAPNLRKTWCVRWLSVLVKLPEKTVQMSLHLSQNSSKWWPKVVFFFTPCTRWSKCTELGSNSKHQSVHSKITTYHLDMGRMLGWDKFPFDNSFSPFLRFIGVQIVNPDEFVSAIQKYRFHIRRALWATK